MSAFSATNGDLACLDGALSRRGVARIGVAAAEVFPLLLLQTKRGKNGDHSSTLTPAMPKPDNCRSILQNFLQQISHPPLWRRAMPTGGGASVAQV